MKEQKEEKVCVMKVTIDIIATTNTYLKTDKTMADVIKTPGGRKETDDAEFTKRPSHFQQIRRSKWLIRSPLTNKSKAKIVKADKISAVAKAEVLETVAATSESLKIEVIHGESGRESC